MAYPHSAPSAAISPDEMDALLGDLEFPPTYTRKGMRNVAVDELITDYGPLTREHLGQIEAQGSASIGVTANPLKALRHTHHRLAQYLAMGMDETKAAKLCSFSVPYVSILKNDPAFGELLAYYAVGVEEEFADFVSAAADLSQDMLEHLRNTLEQYPEKLTPGITLEAIRTLADRSGHSPVTKTHNVNVNVDLGARLAEARKRANAVLIEGTSRVTAGSAPPTSGG